MGHHKYTRKDGKAKRRNCQQVMAFKFIKGILFSSQGLVITGTKVKDV